MKHLIVLIVTAISLNLTTSSASALSCSEPFQDISQSLFIEFNAFAKLNYCRNFCGDNVFKFIDHLETNRPDIPLHGLKVHLITSPQAVVVAHSNKINQFLNETLNKPRIYTLNMENRKTLVLVPDGIQANLPWRHHAVLEFDGKIYDFDYGDRPTAVSKELYYDQIYTVSAEVHSRGERHEVSSFAFPASQKELLKGNIYKAIKQLSSNRSQWVTDPQPEF